MNLTYDPLDPDTYSNVTISTWSDTYTINTSQLTGNKIQIDGDAVFNGNITWQNRDMREWFESVESRLGILKPNSELEAEWSRLAELRQQYVELEREILEKQKVFNILKRDYP